MYWAHYCHKGSRTGNLAWCYQHFRLGASLFPTLLTGCLVPRAQLATNMKSPKKKNQNVTSNRISQSDGDPANPAGCGPPEGGSNLIIWSSNIRGIATNFDCLAHAVFDSYDKPDIIFLNETLIAPKKVPTSGIYEIEGYEIVRQDRHKGGGGNMVYHRDNLPISIFVSCYLSAFERCHAI